MGSSVTGGLLFRIAANSSAFLRESQKTRRELGKMKGGAMSLQKSMVNMAKVAGAAIAAHLSVRQLGKAFNLLAGFEDQMSKLTAISGGTAQEMAGLRDMIRNLGATTRFTASEVASLGVSYSKLGFSVKQIQDLSKATLNLASVSQSDLGEAATVVGTTIRGFNLDASESARVVDVMAKAFTSTALDMEKWSNSMATIAPIASILGLSLEQTAAMLGKLMNRMKDSSKAGTDLRNILLRTRNQGLDLSKAFGQINSSSAKTITATKLFGERAAASAIILAGLTEEIKDFEIELDNASGSAQKMADIMEDNLGGDVRKLKSAFEDLVLDGMTPLNDALRESVQWFKEMIGFINNGAASVDSMNQLFKEIDASRIIELNEEISELDNRLNGPITAFERLFQGVTRKGIFEDLQALKEELSLLEAKYVITDVSSGPKLAEGAGGGGGVKFPSITAEQQRSLDLANEQLRQQHQLLIVLNEIRGQYVFIGDEFESQLEDMTNMYPLVEEVADELNSSTVEWGEQLRGVQGTVGLITRGLAQSGAELKGMGKFLKFLMIGLSIAQSIASLTSPTGFLQGLFKKPPGFALGTSFAPGGLAMVGERGPEMVNLPRGSQVNPLIGGGLGQRQLVADWRLTGRDLHLMLWNEDKANASMGGRTLT